MNKEIVIIIDGAKADVYLEDGITLDFNSSILGDVSSIKCSGSKTIKLPKTATNDTIFDLPHLPSHESAKSHKVLPCSMYVDGSTIFERGLCHLLDSSGDHYEVAVTFGIMHGNFSEWITRKPKLRDLTNYESDSIIWDSSCGVTYKGGGTSQIEGDNGSLAMYYVPYDVGVDLDSVGRDRLNISPCVTLLEVWERIRRENGLPFDFDYQRTDMESNVIVLTKNNNVSLQTISINASLKAKLPVIFYGDGATHRLGFDISECFDVSTTSFVQKGYRQVVIKLPEITLSMNSEIEGSYYEQQVLDFFGKSANCRLVLEYTDGSMQKLVPTRYSNYFKWSARTLTFNKYEGTDVEGKPLVRIYVEIYRWESVPADVWENPNSAAYTFSWGMPLVQALRFGAYGVNINGRTNFIISYENNTNDYPLADFRLVPNLPDITQIDFVNFICKFYGMFPMQQGDNVTFVPFSRLYDNIDSNNIYDWSEKLAESFLYYPNNVGLTIDGYAQRNVITYKEDKNDPVDVSASLLVEDESLEHDKKLIEFPFAASRGNLIPQYSLNDEGELQKNDVEYRIMRIIYGENYENNALKFTDDMKCMQILNRHYSELQDAIRKPMQIEEDIMLSLLDLQTIDYSKPVYLAKYGRFFAIDSIQWTSSQSASKVKLLRIK